MMISCSKREPRASVSFYNDFLYENRIMAIPVQIGLNLIRYPFRLRRIDDKIVMMDLHGSDKFFYVFHYPDFRYITSFGKMGLSPQELLTVGDMRCTSDTSIWALDPNRNKLLRWKYSSTCDSLILNEEIMLDKGIFRALDFALFNDSLFIIPDYSGNRHFCWINRNGKLIGKVGLLPSSDKEAMHFSRPALSQAWRSFIDYNPHNNILASVTQFGEVIEIYNLKTHRFIVKIGKQGEPEFKINDGYGIPTGGMGFSDVQVTDNAIYTVFHGRSFKEIVRSKGTCPDGGQYIYVYSLNGDPLCKYILNCYIYGIYVDERNHMIYATEVNTDNPIVKFHLDRIIK